ncbi:Transcriptional regulator, AbiEi antitoxin, Type IV TA system [Friedmanniella luteola]|uniref:Transcriptional regulator, AbiEi antitoxin, Type IV TA system n=1 Tax=Friedmanniella luteola TaxID=546871 RepID=A0A1H1R5M5_9ACTN|nr:type IV toxin-antitoxin system AbiEi family antitoxin domain-containing protein [Friedmanniella luteola]SDS31057.1 Transcriptional regulator, AbiEi antitoxin, Type IV TA system [Friedmanniella luteola]
MLPRQEPDAQLLALAAQQDGVVTAAQTQAAGLSSQALYRLGLSGRWQRLTRSLYLAAPGPPEWRALAWGGVLLGGQDARIGGAAAGYLHGLLPAAPAQILVLVPEHAVTRDRRPWHFRREAVGVRGASVGSPPRTSVEDTVLDLCDGSTPSRAVGLVTDAVGGRRTSAAQLRRALDGRRRARHRQLLEELLVDVAAGAESPLEVRYLRDVERAHDLPRGDRQNRSGLPFRRDVVYRHGLVVELDGRLGHEGDGHFRDMRRDNRTALAGEMTLRYGTADVAGRPCSVAYQVASALRLRGWSGWLSPCPRCPQGVAELVV